MANGGETKMVQEIVPMAGGDGPQSYAQNSIMQKLGLETAKDLINDGIKDKIDFENPSFEALTTFRIVDVGCSTGPNTFYVVQNLIEAINHKYQTQFQNPPPLEFQVFFNDLMDNDFNTLFRTLPIDRKYFAKGVPGSFYNRLFPKSSIHFLHSSYAVHWLSKIPREIFESPALNKESIYCSRLVKEVTQAYSNQFKNDMNTFLNVRAEEIVSGGLMAIIIAGRPNEDNIVLQNSRVPSINVTFDVLGDSLREMAKLGVINEEKVESFNFPVYDATSKELEEIINRNGHFSIESLEIMKHQAIEADVKLLASHLRATLGGLLKEHFRIDEDILDKIFQSFAKKVEADLSIFDVVNHSIELFIMLKRNIDRNIYV